MSDHDDSETKGAVDAEALAPPARPSREPAKPLTYDEKKAARARVEAMRAGKPVPNFVGVNPTNRRFPALSEHTIEEVRRRISLGAPAEVAAESLGIPHRIWRAWLDLGRVGIGDPLFVRLVEVTERAEAQFEVDSHAALAIGRKGWQARAWQLERRFPERYQPRSRQEVSGPGGGPVVIAAGRVQLPPEEPEPSGEDDDGP